jgi:hypothetical protein
MNTLDIQNNIDQLGVPVVVKSWDPSCASLVVEPPLSMLTYALRQAVLNNLGRGV